MLYSIHNLIIIDTKSCQVIAQVYSYKKILHRRFCTLKIIILVLLDFSDVRHNSISCINNIFQMSDLTRFCVYNKKLIDNNNIIIINCYHLFVCSTSIIL